jgi:hypothetical protein
MNPPVQICSFFSAVRVASHSRWRCFLKKYLVVFFRIEFQIVLYFYIHTTMCVMAVLIDCARSGDTSQRVSPILSLWLYHIHNSPKHFPNGIFLILFVELYSFLGFKSSVATQKPELQFFLWLLSKQKRNDLDAMSQGNSISWQVSQPLTD